MKSQAPRDMAASVRQRLLNLAKERGEEFNFVLLRYGLERLLFRLGESRHAGSFVLKGAIVYAIADQSHGSTRSIRRSRAQPPSNNGHLRRSSHGVIRRTMPDHRAPKKDCYLRRIRQ